MDCATCKNAGTVWAPSWAFPRGFKVFCGGSLTRHEDGVHVEIVCPSCDGESAPLTPPPAEREGWMASEAEIIEVSKVLCALMGDDPKDWPKWTVMAERTLGAAEKVRARDPKVGRGR